MKSRLGFKPSAGNLFCNVFHVQPSFVQLNIAALRADGGIAIEIVKYQPFTVISPGFYFDQAQLVFLLGGLFCFLFGCHVNYSPFHCSWIDATVFCCDCLNV